MERYMKFVTNTQPGWIEAAHYIVFVFGILTFMFCLLAWTVPTLAIVFVVLAFWGVFGVSVGLFNYFRS